MGTAGEATLTETLRVTWALYRRSMTRLLRRPMFLYFSLIQPAIWLLLFSQVMKNFGKAALPPNVSYVTLFAPAVMLQTVLFGSFQSGMAMVSDIEMGTLDKYLIAPINRMSILIGRALSDGTRMFIQSLIIILLSMTLGVRFAHGPIGVVGAILFAVIFGMGLAGFSNVIALRTKNSESTLVIGNFFIFPLLFLSPALVPRGALPGWIETFGKINPVAYAVDAARNLTVGVLHGRTLSRAIDWPQLGRSAAFLLAVLVVSFTLAQSTFKKATA
ncbi:MAG: ABC transporter permease [Actinomycetota bacterium]|nr:ABC transporter permease [Actinomycetota bacterium]